MQRRVGPFGGRLLETRPTEDSALEARDPKARAGEAVLPSEELLHLLSQRRGRRLIWVGGRVQINQSTSIHRLDLPPRRGYRGPGFWSAPPSPPSAAKEIDRCMVGGNEPITYNASV